MPRRLLVPRGKAPSTATHFRRFFRYEPRGALLKCTAAQNGGDAKLTGRSGENFAVGQAIELFTLGTQFENFRSSCRITGQHADGEIEGLTGSIERMGPMCHQ